MSDTPPTPAKKKGQHKPDCACNWCAVRLRNIAKKNAAKSDAKPSAENAVGAKDSGVDSKPSSPPNSPPSGMAAKIASMKSTAAPTKKNESAKPAVTTLPPAEPSGWFNKLFSGATFFED